MPFTKVANLELLEGSSMKDRIWFYNEDLAEVMAQPGADTFETVKAQNSKGTEMWVLIALDVNGTRLENDTHLVAVGCPPLNNRKGEELTKAEIDVPEPE